MNDMDLIYMRRNERVERILAKPTITISDVCGLDRIGRFCIAHKGFWKCPEEAQMLLLNDHPHVSAAARISQGSGR